MPTGRFLIGTSGWSYRPWHGDFYPADLTQADELRYLSAQTTATEVNATFYRLQQPSSFRRWGGEVPEGHLFAVKGSRYITHMKQLRDPRPALGNFFASGLLALGDRLDVVLWQLPARTVFRPEVLGPFLETLPRTMSEAAQLAAEHDERIGGDAVHLETAVPEAPLRHALEPRHTSFRAAEAVALLVQHDVATVYSDSPEAWPVLDLDTASFRYVRLHGHDELYRSRYSDKELADWAERCSGWAAAGQDVHLYFDNDGYGHAPHDAVRLLKMLGIDHTAQARAERRTG